MKSKYMGLTVVDAITGFKGIVTAHVTFITGCDQVCIQPGAGADGNVPEGKYVDVIRVRILDEPKVEFKNAIKTTGCGELPTKKNRL